VELAAVAEGFEASRSGFRRKRIWKDVLTT
jgi:hypothetical protein